MGMTYFIIGFSLISYFTQIAIIIEGLNYFDSKKDMLKWLIPGMIAWELTKDIRSQFNKLPWESKND